MEHPSTKKCPKCNKAMSLMRQIMYLAEVESADSEHLTLQPAESGHGVALRLYVCGSCEFCELYAPFLH